LDRRAGSVFSTDYSRPVGPTSSNDPVLIRV
jgi:hypothetical protein